MRLLIRTLTATSIAAAVVVGALVGPAAGVDVTGADRYHRVGVPVATLWVAPSSPRAIDAAALGTGANPADWLRGLTVSGRRGLNGRVESQALYGQPVKVRERSGAWSRVVLPGQPSPKAAGGYPGWIPTKQLVPAAPTAAEAGSTTGLEAVVRRHRVWTYSDRARTERALRLSYGTRLVVLADRGATISVAGPDGRVLWVSAKRVLVVPTGEPARPATRKAVVAQAGKFLGLKYLWGGTSGFGFDCSGLTHAIYAQLGVKIPRDATPQFGMGTPMTRKSDLRRGDLVFFRNDSGVLHHVGVYVGGGRMIHSPRTGEPVQYSSITSGLWSREFAGGRRYL